MPVEKLGQFLESPSLSERDEPPSFTPFFSTDSNPIPAATATQLLRDGITPGTWPLINGGLYVITLASALLFEPHGWVPWVDQELLFPWGDPTQKRALLYPAGQPVGHSSPTTAPHAVGKELLCRAERGVCGAGRMEGAVESGGEGKGKASSISRFRRVCVFCGSSSGKRSSYRDAAVELGEELVTDHHVAAWFLD